LTVIEHNTIVGKLKGCRLGGSSPDLPQKHLACSCAIRVIISCGWL